MSSSCFAGAFWVEMLAALIGVAPALAPFAIEPNSRMFSAGVQSTATRQARLFSFSLELTAYEVGIKAGLLERRLQANVSAFYYDYKDKQLSVYFADPIYTALSRLQNVPDSEAYGLDGEVTWRITPQLTAVASGTLLHTEVQGYVGINSAGQPQDFDGAPFLYSPKRSGAVTLLYGRELTGDLGLQAALNARWQDDSHADLEGDPKFTIKDYGLVNASLGVHRLDDRWRAQLWVRNLTNTYYWTAVSSNANVVVRFPGQPRTYGASLTFAF